MELEWNPSGQSNTSKKLNFSEEIKEAFKELNDLSLGFSKTLQEIKSNAERINKTLSDNISEARKEVAKLEAIPGQEKEAAKKSLDAQHLETVLEKSLPYSLQEALNEYFKKNVTQANVRELRGGEKDVYTLVEESKQTIKQMASFIEKELQTSPALKDKISDNDKEERLSNYYNKLITQLSTTEMDPNATYLQRDQARRARVQEELSTGRLSYQEHYRQQGGSQLGQAIGYFRDLANRNKVSEMGTSGVPSLYQETSPRMSNNNQPSSTARGTVSTQQAETQRRIEADKRSDLKDDYETAKPETVKVSDLTPSAIQDVETGFTNALEKTLLPFLKEEFLEGLAKKVSGLGLAAGAMAMGAGADQPPQEEESSSWFDWFNGKDKNNKNKKGGGWWKKAKNAGKWALSKGKSLGRGAWNLGKGAANIARSGASQVAAGASWLGGGMSQALGASSLSSIGTAGSAAIAGAATLAVGTAAAGAAIGYGLEKYGGVGTKTLDALGYGADEKAMQENQEQTNEALKNINEKFKDDPLRKKIATLMTLKAQLIQDGTLLKGEDKEFNEKQIARLEGQIQKKKAELKEKEEGGGKKEELKKETANLVEKNLTEADLEGPPAPEGPPVPEAAPEASVPEPVAEKLGEKKPAEEMYDPEGLLKDETFLEKKGAYDESKENLKLDIDISKIPYVEDQKAAYTRAYTEYQAGKAKGLSNTQLHARFQAMQRAKNSWQSSEQAYQHLADRGIDPSEMNINQVKQIRNMDVPLFNQEGEHKDISKYVSEDKQEAYKNFFDARKDFNANYEMYDGSDYGDDTPAHWQTLPNAPVLSQPKTKVNDAESVNRDEKQQESVKPELNENNALTAETNQKLDQLIGIMAEKEMGNFSPVISPGGNSAPSPDTKSGQSVSRAYQFRAQNRPEN